ncbi:MAG TPA: F0F1 ATP synthase subunit B' [Stellaceae bacterium]|nr:F0F1 ATP synthase subunit B' [Stellaceae bacterium]
MPQLDFSTFPPQLVWLAVTFVALYLVMAYFGLPRVASILGLRRDRIDGDLAQAARMKSEAEAVIAAYERALAEARAAAQATMRETTERLNEAAAERQRKLAATLAAETATAERRIAEAKSQALSGLRNMASELVRAAAMKVAGAEIDAAHAGDAVDAVMRERA